jgi:hypothetical protein
MLIISRKKDQKIIVADEIEITILEVGRNRVRFGINAPKHIAIQTRQKTSEPPPDAGGPPSVGPEDKSDAKTAAAAALGLP